MDEQFPIEAQKMMDERFGRDTLMTDGVLFSHGTRYDIRFASDGE